MGLELTLFSSSSLDQPLVPFLHQICNQKMSVQNDSKDNVPVTLHGPIDEIPSPSKSQKVGTLDSIHLDFKSSWESCLELILKAHHFSAYEEEERKWLKQILENNVPHGKLGRGVTFIAFFRATKLNRTESEDVDSYLYGWCLQMLQAVSLIADDIMDGSVTRRGKPCWYKESNVGMLAVNDALMIERLVDTVMGRYFKGKEFYLPLLKIVQKVKYYMILGQYLDTSSAKDGDMKTFSIKKYSTIAQMKTSYFSIYAPVVSGIIFAGIKDSTIISMVENISLEIGEMFQIQDDFLDCFGDTEITGKVGTDIIERKCTWLFVKALEPCNEENKNELQQCYGIDNQNMENRVKDLYLNLELPKIYKEYEDNTYKSLLLKIKNLPECIPKTLFAQMLKKMYRRDK